MNQALSAALDYAARAWRGLVLHGKPPFRDLI